VCGKVCGKITYSGCFRYFGAIRNATNER